MPVSPEDAGAEIQRFIVGLNASKHSAREKALRAFRAFVEKQGMEFYDDDVDSLLLGDGYAMGLMQWCGESSTGTQGALKRTAATAIALLKWLVSLQDSSGDDNIFLARFLQVAIEDLRKMRLELHLLITGTQKGKASSRGGKSEEACEIVSLILQHHQNDSGQAEEISVEELLPDEEAGKIFVDWLQQTAMGKQNNIRLNSGGGGKAGRSPDAGMGESRERSGGEVDAATGEAGEEGPDGLNDDDTPLTWAEVDQEQFVVLNNRAGPVVTVDLATKADEPVADPLGLKQVDLRIYQKTLAEGDPSASAEVNGGDRETSGTLQAKKRALLGQKDRLRLLKKMQSGKERVQRNMDGGRSGQGDGGRDGDVGAAPESKPSVQEISRSVVPTTEDFDPALFMTVIHAAASFSDIRNGLESLDGAQANQASELQRLVRDHFDSFVRCADSIEKYASHINMELSKNKEQPKEDTTAARPRTLAQLRMQLKAEREAEVETRPPGSVGDAWSGPGPAAKSHLKELTRLMEGARTEAGTNFSQLLQKLDNIKQVRAAQHLLSEKGSILDIPREMSACMADGKYMELVKLYRKAHTTYSSSILSQVRVEAEAVGKQACVRLLETLRSADVSLQEQVDAVGYLQDLQYEGEEPLQACFNGQKKNFLENATQCREAMETLLLAAFAYRRSGGRAENRRDQQGSRNSARDHVSHASRLDPRKGLSASSPGRAAASKLGSTSEDLTDSEDFSPARSLHGGGARFFDFQESDVLLLLLPTDASDDESLYEGSRHRNDDGRSDSVSGRMQGGLQELEGMELDEDLAVAVPSGMDALTHRISVARLQHVSNLAWCLGSWLPHLVSLAVLLIRLEHRKSGRGTEDGGGGQPSPQVHIRKLCGPGAFGGGASDYADGDTASVTTSGPRAASTVHEAASTLESDDSFATGRRDRVGTKAEKELTKLFEAWLNSTTFVLRAAIFGDDTASDKASPGRSGANAPRGGRRSASSTTGAYSGADAPLFAGNMQGGLSNKYAGEPHLKEPLDARYLRQAFSSLAHLYDSLSQALGGSWEGDVVLTPGLRALEKLVKEAQALHVRSEMAALATEAKSLMDVDPWLAPEPPHPPGGTRLPHLFGALAHERMLDLVDLLPRAEWSAAEVTHGLSDAVQCLLSCVTALGTRAYEASRIEKQSTGVPISGAGALTIGGGLGEEGLSADHQLLCQIGNCLQLDTVILPELWDAAVDLFDASRAGVVSDRKRTQKVQEKVMSKYLKRKYRELKMYVKNGWWGYARPAPRSGKDASGTDLGLVSRSERASNTRNQRRLSTTITKQRNEEYPMHYLKCCPYPNTAVEPGVRALTEVLTESHAAKASLRLKRGTHLAYASAGSTASVARQASMLSSRSDVSTGQAKGTRRGTMVNRRAGLKTALNLAMRTPKPQSLPSYLVKVLLSLVQARLEAKEALRGLLYRKAGMHDGKMRKDILYADFVLRESARQVMEIVCDCANARVAGEGHLGAKPLDGSDPVEQAEKIAQAEFLRDALYRFLPSATLDRVNRVIKRLQSGKFEGTLGRSGGKASSSSSIKAETQDAASARDGLARIGSLRGRDKDGAAANKATKPATSVPVADKKQTSVSDSLGAAMPGSFLTATDLQELARVYVVCLK